MPICVIGEIMLGSLNMKTYNLSNLSRSSHKGIYFKYLGNFPILHSLFMILKFDKFCRLYNSSGFVSFRVTSFDHTQIKDLHFFSS